MNDTEPQNHQELRTGPSGNIYAEPPDLIQFVSTENQQFMTTLVNYREEVAFTQHLHGLYRAAMSKQSADEKQIIIFQLLTLVHYHFLFATACYMRCHLADAFNSARIAIDAALIAAQVIHDRPSQVAYVKRTKPFDKLIRHFKNLIRDNPTKLPHPFIPYLVKMHDMCSQAASHADIETFAHRLDFFGSPGNEHMMSVGYFQFPRDPNIFKHHFLGLLRIFAVTLEIFAPFIVNEHKSLPTAWAEELRKVGMRIEARQNAIAPEA